MTGLEHLWATWRAAYVSGESDAAVPDGDGSLFERILGSGRTDEEILVVHRGRLCVVMLNRFPYTSGHLMVMPKRAVAELEDLDPDEAAELWDLVRRAVVALKTAYSPDGVNIGMNLGRAAGAGVSEHLHVHVLPRWLGDTNFMTTVSGTRVLPEALDVTWRKVRDAWPR
ncbi:MAG: hydrolase [Acidimicrobiales bacterium]|nr:MAG: hydrolase [Acidimicrobiales bacterium]